MENYTITNQDQYFDCIHRLEYLENISPQTERMKKEIELIQVELNKYEKVRAN